MGVIYGSKEYQEEIFSKMYSGEEILAERNKKIPRTMGLWNVCVREIGLLESFVNYVQPLPQNIDDSERTSTTVVVSVKLRPYIGRYYPTTVTTKEPIPEDQRILSNDIYECQATFDVGKYNNPDFYLFLTSTAETNALGRALKKIMALNCHTKEELAAGNISELKGIMPKSDVNSVKLATPAQMKVINGHIKNLNIDESKLYQHVLSREDNKDLLKVEANILLESLTNWDSNGKAIAAVIKS